MGNEKTKFTEQDILNCSTDDAVTPPLLTVGQRYWTGSAWAKVTANGGGGTEYADGAARGTATGGLCMVDDGTLIQSMKGDSSGRPQINIDQVAGAAAVSGSGNATGALRVELPTNGTGVVGLNAGTNAIGKLAANTGVTIGAVELAAAQTLATVTSVTTVATVTALTGGNVAHDAADAGNPHKVGARATNVDIAAVSATNDRTDLVATLTGKLITHPWSNPENFVSGAITSAMTGTTSTSLIAAPASGLRNYITQITVSNSHATVGTDVIIQDGSGGTTLYTIPAAAVYGGAVLHFPVPLRQPTTATAIFCANVTTGSSIKVSASGFKAA